MKTQQLIALGARWPAQAGRRRAGGRTSASHARQVGGERERAGVYPQAEALARLQKA